MNKTVNINLGGMFFHIDEDAYQKLSRYFDAIRRSLNNSTGQEEIIRDIEIRIAELVAEKHTTDNQVISLRELDEIITVMGQPEDYRIDDEEERKTTSTFYTTNGQAKKKLYRDRETGIIGGVLAGMGHYFGVDKVWVRVLFIFLTWFYGAGILAYIILWVVMPEAVTTSEKLEMKGEPITISNIEKKVREEFDAVSEKFKSTDYGKVGNSVKDGAARFSTSLGDVIISIFKILAKIFAVFMILGALPVLVLLMIGVFTIGSTAFPNFPWQRFLDAGNFSDYPVWVSGLLILFAAGIPLFYFILLAFKILMPKMKSPHAYANYSLLALWIVSVGLLAALGVKQFSEYAFDGNVTKKEVLQLNPADTLKIKFAYNENYANNLDERSEYSVELTKDKQKVLYSTNVDFRIEKSDDNKAYIQIEKSANGSSMSTAKEKAEKITYGYKFEGNTLILDNYLLTDFNNKYRDQNVTITLFLPKGVVFKADESVQNYDSSDDEFFNLHFSSGNYTYRVGDKVKCLDCPADENEYDDVETEQDTTATMTVKVNGEEVKIETTASPSGKTKGLTIDKNGVIIKK